MNVSLQENLKSTTPHILGLWVPFNDPFRLLLPDLRRLPFETRTAGLGVVQAGTEYVAESSSINKSLFFLGKANRIGSDQIPQVSFPQRLGGVACPATLYKKHGVPPGQGLAGV